MAVTQVQQDGSMTSGPWLTPITIEVSGWGVTFGGYYYKDGIKSTLSGTLNATTPQSDPFNGDGTTKSFTTTAAVVGTLTASVDGTPTAVTTVVNPDGTATATFTNAPAVGTANVFLDYDTPLQGHHYIGILDDGTLCVDPDNDAPPSPLYAHVVFIDIPTGASDLSAATLAQIAHVSPASAARPGGPSEHIPTASTGSAGGWTW